MAAALSRGASSLEAVRFACAVVGVSVTRPGIAPSMPTLAEVEALLRGKSYRAAELFLEKIDRPGRQSAGPGSGPPAGA